MSPRRALPESYSSDCSVVAYQPARRAAIEIDELPDVCSVSHRAVEAPLAAQTIQLPKITVPSSNRVRRGAVAVSTAAAASAMFMLAATSGVSRAEEPSADAINARGAATVSRSAERIDLTIDQAGESAEDIQAARTAALDETSKSISDRKAADEAQKVEEERQEQEAAADAASQGAELAAAIQSDVSSSATTSAPVITVSGEASETAMAAVNFALAQVGKPYVWGATGPNAYDCSGLMLAAYGSVGVSLPRTAAAQGAAGQTVSPSAMQPGDLIVQYGGGHVGMYIGNGMMVHAANSQSGVIVSAVPMGAITTVARVA